MVKANSENIKKGQKNKQINKLYTQKSLTNSYYIIKREYQTPCLD